MEMIVISKKRFEELLAETGKDLEITKFTHKSYCERENLINDMHRAFHYHLHIFADKLRKEN